MTTRRLTLLLSLLVTLLFALGTVGCPATGTANDDDSGGAADDDDSPADMGDLCEGPGCINHAECPTEEPSVGDACSFDGDCHYCPEGDSMSAGGFTCDGTSLDVSGFVDCTQ